MEVKCRLRRVGVEDMNVNRVTFVDVNQWPRSFTVDGVCQTPKSIRGKPTGLDDELVIVIASAVGVVLGVVTFIE